MISLSTLMLMDTWAVSSMGLFSRINLDLHINLSSKKIFTIKAKLLIGGNLLETENHDSIFLQGVGALLSLNLKAEAGVNIFFTGVFIFIAFFFGFIFYIIDKQLCVNLRCTN